jgi:hypothetical protein
MQEALKSKTRHKRGDYYPNLNADALSCAGMDSAALITEPTLKAWGVPFDFLHEDGDLTKISSAFRQAMAQSQPVAVLITDDLG